MFKGFSYCLGKVLLRDKSSSDDALIIGKGLGITLIYEFLLNALHSLVSDELAFVLTVLISAFDPQPSLCSY